MRFACFLLVISAAYISADVEVIQRLSDTQEYQDVVNYLNENASGDDLLDIIESFDEILEDFIPADGARSIGSMVDKIFHEIPWAKVSQYIEAKLANNPKFAKLHSMINDPKFQDLLNKTVNSQAFKNYAKSVESNGFTFSGFVSFALKAICDTAVASHPEVYSEGVCQALKAL